MNQKKTSNPKWLKKLTKESWQAELIISGIATYGALQLPELINNLGDWAVTYFLPEMAFILWSIMGYLSFASSVLIIGFILHFVLRAIWIGLIGLNSVYPNGINTNSTIYSTSFLEKLKRDFSIDYSGLKDLDKVCSVIFTVNTLFLIIAINLTANIILLYGLKCILNLFLVDYLVNIIFWGIIGLLLSVSLLPNILNIKKIKANKAVQAIGYKIFKIFAIIFHHIFRKPYLYLWALFTSNLKRSESIVFLIVIMGVASMLSIYHLKESSILYFLDSKRLFEQYERTDQVHREVYETNLTEKSGPILSTIIESELISGNMMKVFIPVFQNEEPIYNNMCGEYSKQAILSNRENEAKRRAFLLNCFNKYHRITVNDSIVPSELFEHQYSHKRSYGMLTYLPTNGFKNGQNMLKVEKLTGDSTKVYRTMNIPFWFEGE